MAAIDARCVSCHVPPPRAPALWTERARERRSPHWVGQSWAISVVRSRRCAVGPPFAVRRASRADAGRQAQTVASFSREANRRSRFDRERGTVPSGRRGPALAQSQLGAARRAVRGAETRRSFLPTRESESRVARVRGPAGGPVPAGGRRLRGGSEGEVGSHRSEGSGGRRQAVPGRGRRNSRKRVAIAGRTPGGVRSSRAGRAQKECLSRRKSRSLRPMSRKGARSPDW